jgi:hypothetical protein
MNLVSDITDYLISEYGKTITINNLEEKNLCFDLTITDRNINIKYEYKHRLFITGKNEKYLYMNDLLVELVQGCFELKNILIKKLSSSDLNSNTNLKRINTTIGWFYKCSADRLLYIKYLDGILYDVIDIDFKTFKTWFFNYSDSQNGYLNWCGLTTGTINAIVPYKDIPRVLYRYKKYQV